LKLKIIVYLQTSLVMCQLTLLLNWAENSLKIQSIRNASKFQSIFTIKVTNFVFLFEKPKKSHFITFARLSSSIPARVILLIAGVLYRAANYIMLVC
jgi:hypothetical protein